MAPETLRRIETCIFVVSTRLISFVVRMSIQPLVRSSVSLSRFAYIYTSSVFSYDKHKKNFDIHFSMKRHEPV